MRFTILSVMMVESAKNEAPLLYTVFDTYGPAAVEFTNAAIAVAMDCET